MFEKRRSVIVFVILVASVAAYGERVTCPKCGYLNEEDANLCEGEECGYPLPIPDDENGVAIFRFLGVARDTDRSKNFVEEFIEAIDNTKRYTANMVLYNTEYENLRPVFELARGADQQLILVGSVSESGEKVWVSAQFFDVETAYVLASCTSYYDTGTGGKTLSEAVDDIVQVLPLRGRWTNGSTFRFINLPSDFTVEKGGRLEVVGGYSYDMEKLEQVKDPLSDFAMCLALVEPKLVTIDPTAYDISNSADGLTQLEIKKTGGKEFKKYDICYYYPPPEVPVEREVPPAVEREIAKPTPTREPWFVYLGGAYARHSYEYTEGLKSREDAGSAEFRFGYHRPWDWPVEVAGGYAAHVPVRYKYEYGGIYEGRGSIKGAYVSSVILSAAYVFSVPVWRFELMPKFGGEGEYFFPAGNGTYEQEGGWEWYYNELWNGFLIGPKAAVAFNFGPVKQYGLTFGFSPSWPLGGNYRENFGPLLRFALGMQYYF
jgi:hypothetical protein